MGKVVDMFPDKEKVYRNQVVTLGDLEDFKTALLEGVKAIITTHQPASGKQWLKSYEVKKLLGISTGTLQNLRANGTLPYTKMGGLIFYDATDINNILELRKKGIPRQLANQL